MATQSKMLSPKNRILICIENTRRLVCDILWFMSIEPYSTHTPLSCWKICLLSNSRACAFKSDIKLSKYETQIYTYIRRKEKEKDLSPLHPTLNYDSLIFFIHRQASSNMLQLEQCTALDSNTTTAPPSVSGFDGAHKLINTHEVIISGI